MILFKKFVLINLIFCELLLLGSDPAVSVPASEQTAKDCKVSLNKLAACIFAAACVDNYSDINLYLDTCYSELNNILVVQNRQLRTDSILALSCYGAACAAGDSRILQLFLDCRFAPEMRMPGGITNVDIAALYGNIELLRMFKDMGVRLHLGASRLRSNYIYLNAKSFPRIGFNGTRQEKCIGCLNRFAQDDDLLGPSPSLPSAEYDLEPGSSIVFTSTRLYLLALGRNRGDKSFDSECTRLINDSIRRTQIFPPPASPVRIEHGDSCCIS